MSRTYTELVADLQEWLEDDDTEFAASIPRLINLGELRVIKDLDLGIFKEDQTAATVGSQEFVTYPATTLDLVAWKSIYYDNAGQRVWLELRGSDYVRDYQVPAATGAPRYYAEENGQWLLAPIPDAIYTLNARALVRPAPLSVSNTTNWLSDTVDDLLFKACLAESDQFLKSDDRVAMWKQEYQELLPTTKRDVYTLLGEHYQLTPLEVPGVPTTGR